MKSRTGAQLERAAILAVDSKGKRIPPLPAGFEGIRCKESPPHALSNPNAETSREEQLERDGRRARWIEALTEDEREVLRLQGKLQHRVEIRERILAGDLVHYLRDDYTLIPGSEVLEDHPSGRKVQTVQVVGYEVIQVEALNYEAISEHLDKTVRQVKRIVASAHKKYRAATR